jgi:hypothetical protein
LTNWDLRVLYIDEPPTHWSTTGWGEEYGRSLGAGEDERIFASLIGDRSPEPRDVSTPEEVRTVIEEGIKVLRKRGGEHLCIALNGSWIGFLAVTESPLFQPEAGSIDRWTPVPGRYDGHPVVNLLSPDPDAIVIFDVTAACRWQQHRPPADRADFALSHAIDNVLAVELKELDLAQARAMVEERSLFREARGRSLTLEESVLELRTRVLIRVLEWFTFEVDVPELVWIAQGPEI